MRLASLVMLLVLTACAGASVSTGTNDPSVGLQIPGNDALRDGFYDGGIFDPDLTRRDLPVPE